MQINENNLNRLMEKVIIDVGAAMNAALIVIGDRMGLYKALFEAGPLNAEQLAAKTGTAERYVREWIRAQAAGGYVTYDPEEDNYSLSAEQALLFADEESPAFVVGGFQVSLAAVKSAQHLQEVFTSGEGIAWQEHDHDLFDGTERFFRPGYAANLVKAWIPSLDGVEQKLQNGAKVADLGCGHGASTILMAQAYPNSRFFGFDAHAESIQTARQRAGEAGVADRVRFEVASLKNYDGAPYDLVMIFDTLHDLGDPVGAAAHMLSTLRPEGTLMIVEPYAHDTLSRNLNPLGRMMYAASTFFCTPNSLSQEVGTALGAQAGETRIREVAFQAGFTRFRRVNETPVNLVFEARP